MVMPYQQQPVSFYPGCTSPGCREVITLADWLEGIRTGRWCDLVDPARAEYKINGKSALYSRLKRRLPAVTPAGLFIYREIAGFSEPSGILHGDVDGLSARRLQWARESLQADPYVVYLFASPSGMGLKFGVAIPLVVDDADYKARFWGLYHYCRRVHGIELDTTCQDISRLCFVSVDPQCYVNSRPELFTETADPPTPGVGAHAKSAPIHHRFPLPKRLPNVSTSSAARNLLERALRRLENAPERGRHGARLATGTLVGGLITGGVLSHDAAETLIQSARDHSRDPNHAEQTIRDAIRFGANAPIGPEHRMLNRARIPHKGRHHG